MNSCRWRWGISLAEVSVVTALLGVVLLVLSKTFGQSAKVSIQARVNQTANALLEKMASDLRRVNFYFITGADSDEKNGTVLTADHRNYMVDWNRSQMGALLQDFDRRVREAGFSRFKISCQLLFRTNTQQLGDAANGDQYFSFTPYVNNITVDSKDPTRMRFVDRNGDGQYYNSIYDSSTGTWIPEFPPVSIKDLTITVYAKGKEAGSTVFRLDLNDFSKGPTNTSENKVRLTLQLPAITYLHERVTEVQKSSLDRPLAKPLPTLFGMPYPCREKRFDTVYDPDKGYGGLVVQGQSLPGAVVSIYTYAEYANCFGCAFNLTGRSWGTPQQTTISDKSGTFTMFLDAAMMDKVRADYADVKSKPLWKTSLVGRASLNGVSSADVFQTYTASLSAGPSPRYSQPTGEIKTLAPRVSFVSSPVPANENTVTLKLNGNEYGGFKGYLMSGQNPYARLPPILANNTGYAVEVEYADAACYTSTGTWNFDVKVGVDATPPIVSFSYFPPYSTVVNVCVSDNESGVDYRTIDLRVDGSPKGSDYVNLNYSLNGHAGGCFGVPIKDLTSGSHTISISAANFSLGTPAIGTGNYAFVVP